MCGRTAFNWGSQMTWYSNTGSITVYHSNTIMQVRYSRHLETRLALRNIPKSLPHSIYDEAEERFIDLETGYIIAVKEVHIYGRNRDIMIAYQQEDDEIVILTIHPLKDNQKENRITIGRWLKI